MLCPITIVGCPTLRYQIIKLLYRDISSVHPPVCLLGALQGVLSAPLTVMSGFGSFMPELRTSVFFFHLKCYNLLQSGIYVWRRPQFRSLSTKTRKHFTNEF